MHFSRFARLAAVAILSLSPAAVRAAEPEAFFPIMPWDYCSGDPAKLHEMKECGFTVAGFAFPKDLDAVAKEGMKAIVSDARCASYDWAGKVDDATVAKNVESLVAEVGKHPAVFGYYLRDEPTTSYFPGLAKVAAEIQKRAPGKWPYINLFPNYATAEQLGAKSYDDYIEQFVAACHPPILSYDHYALADDGTLRGAYWPNLEAMRAASIRHKIPFWNIVLGNAHFSNREPSLADLRFEAFSTLAYGGRGISYFTYFAPKVGNYRAAAIDQFGHKTPTWDNLRYVNLQLQTLAPTILKLTSTKVYHFDKTAGTSAPPADSLVAGGDGALMVGEFKHEDGSDYVMIVNKDVTHSRHGGQLQWRTAPKSLTLVSPYIPDATFPFEGEQVWIAPGGGALLKVVR